MPVLRSRWSSAGSAIREQLHRRGLGLCVSLGAGVLALSFAAYVAGRTGVPLAALVRDPAAIARHPFYYGFFSNLGVVLWAACGGFLVLGSVALWTRRGRTPHACFLACFACTTWMLALDDLYMVHEDAYRQLLPGPEEVPLAAYAAVLFAGLFAFRRLIWQSDWLPLAFALGFFAASILADVILDQGPLQHYLEDAAKLLGIIAWVHYFGVETLRSLRAEP